MTRARTWRSTAGPQGRAGAGSSGSAGRRGVLGCGRATGRGFGSDGRRLHPDVDADLVGEVADGLGGQPSELCQLRAGRALTDGLLDGFISTQLRAYRYTEE